MLEDMEEPENGNPLIEIKCSRCDRFNYDSSSGVYNEKCTDGNPCDTNGTKYEDGIAV